MIDLLVLLVLTALVVFPTAKRQASAFFPFRRAYPISVAMWGNIVALGWEIGTMEVGIWTVLQVLFGALVWQEWKLMFLSKKLVETLDNAKMVTEEADLLLYQLRKGAEGNSV